MDKTIVLKSVPAVNRQELLSYIAKQSAPTTVKISTHAGLVHSGIVISIGTPKHSEPVLVLQLISPANELLNSFLHTSVSSIESIELTYPGDILNILSLGASVTNHYKHSGKLEAQRAFQEFSTAILNTTGVPVGVPEMDLPNDGLQLNRIIKCTQIIQGVLIELFRDKDARHHWKEKYSKMAFIHDVLLELKPVQELIEIHFPFEDINAVEIPHKELKELLMAVL